MKKLTWVCDSCNQEIRAIHALGLKKAIATHRSMVHGIPGKYSQQNKQKSSQATRDAALVRYYEKSGTTPKSPRAIAAFQRHNGVKVHPAEPASGIGSLTATSPEELRRRKNERQRAYREAKRNQSSSAPLAQTHFAKLDSCPCCGAKFYYTLPN